jgi:hypothetical protein
MAVWPVVVALVMVAVRLRLIWLQKRRADWQAISVEDRPGLLLWLLLILLWLAIEVEHIIWQIKFPVDRAAIYFIPLFLWLLVQSAYDGWRQIGELKKQWAGRLGVCLALIYSLLFIHFFSNLNLNQTIIWPYDVHTKEAVAELDRLAEQIKPGQKMSLGINWLSEPAVNFYLMKGGRGYFNYVDRYGPSGADDFYYLLSRDQALLLKYNLSVIRRFSNPEAFLAAPAELAEKLKTK